MEQQTTPASPSTETRASRSRKKGTAIAATASTFGGIAIGATLFGPTLAGAQDETPEAETAPEIEETDARPERGDGIATALQGLIDDGTLTQEQADAVVETLVEARAEARADRPGRHRGGFGGGADLSGVLGLERAELRAALADGSTLADVAEAQGVSSDELVDALVEAAEERVNAALEAERIDQDRADEILAGAEEKAEALVNGEADFGRNRGFRGGPADADTDA